MSGLTPLPPPNAEHRRLPVEDQTSPSVRRPRNHRTMRRLPPLCLGIVAAGGLAIVGNGQAPLPLGPFTAEQANAGRAAYLANCASCHLPDLAGRNEASQLAGSSFM